MEGLCQRYHKAPWDILKADTRALLRHLTVYHEGHRDEAAETVAPVDSGFAELGGLAEAL